MAGAGSLRRLLRPPGAVCGPVRTGEHDRVAVRVAKPDLPVVRSAVAVRRVAMAGKNNLCGEVGCPGDGGVEIAHFEP